MILKRARREIIVNAGCPAVAPLHVLLERTRRNQPLVQLLAAGRRVENAAQVRQCFETAFANIKPADAVIDALGTFQLLGLRYPTCNLVAIAIAGAVALALWYFIYGTRFGVMLRATAQDRRMASALGLNVGMIYILAFALGSFMAGLGGAIVVPTQTAVLGLSIEMLVIAFVVVVIGGLGSLKGALIGALIVSFLRTAGIQFFPEIELAVLYLIVVAVLLVRPTGMFGRA